MHAKRTPSLAPRANATHDVRPAPDVQVPVLPPSDERPRGHARSTLHPQDLGVHTDSRSVYLEVTRDPAVMHALTRSPRRHRWYRLRRTETGSRSLTAVAEEVVDLANAGAPEATARRFELFVRRVIDDCYTGAAHRTLDELDHAECAAEGDENRLTLVLRIDGETPERLDEAAQANEREAAVELERARLLRRRARWLRTHGGTATLPPAA